MFTYDEKETLQSTSKISCAQKTKLYLAGHVAQEFMQGSADVNYCKTYAKKAFASALEEELDGFDITAFSSKELQALKQKARMRILCYKQELRELFAVREKTLNALIDALCKERTLHSAELQAIIAS